MMQTIRKQSSRHFLNKAPSFRAATTFPTSTAISLRANTTVQHFQQRNVSVQTITPAINPIIPTLQSQQQPPLGNITSPTFAMASVLQNMKNCTQATISAYEKWDYADIQASRADEFVYQFRPESLGFGPMNNEGYKAFFVNSMQTCFQPFRFEIQSITHDPETRKGMIHSFVNTDTVIGPSRLELVMMLTFNEAGDKLIRIDEMFDSAGFSGFWQRYQEHLKQQSPQSETSEASSVSAPSEV